MCCCKKRQKSTRTNNENRRGFLGMFAKLDEFESLTPLIITPGSTPSASKLASPSTAFEAPSTSRSKTITPVIHDPIPNRLAPRLTFSTLRTHLDPRLGSFSSIPPRQTILVSNSPLLTSSDSPPPPRKNPTGKTLIVPLGPNNNNRLSRTPLIPFAPLLGTPDSRVTSFEAGTTKSCATIPEDDELALDSEDGEPEQTANSIDLVSIDRTYGSVPAPIRMASSSAYDIQVPSNVPEFKLPTPCYTPPAPPSIVNSTNGQSPRSLKRAVRNNHNSRMHDSPNLSSPEGSSCGIGSPIDTSGSLSDSCLIPSEEDIDSRARVYYIETAEQSRQELGNRGAMVSEIELTDSDDHRQQLPPLQRIDEESEFEGSIVNSATGSHFDQERNIIPRSISQQLALMHNDKERRVRTKPSGHDI